MHVLVTDDHEDILESTSMLLELRGYKVTTNADASRIMPLARAQQPDVVLQDVHMPGFDLLTLLDHWGGDRSLRHIPVVVFTASADDHSMFLDAGAAAVCRKPFDIDVLANTLEEIAARYRGRERDEAAVDAAVKARGAHVNDGSSARTVGHAKRS